MFNGNWSTANSSIATVDAYGTHSGQGLGSTTTSTWASIQQWRPHSFSCPITVVRPGGGDNVTPQIHQGSCSGTDITGTTQSVVIGQQIALCATYNLPSGVSITQQSWYPDSGSTIVGGYSPPPQPAPPLQPRKPMPSRLHSIGRRLELRSYRLAWSLATVPPALPQPPTISADLILLRQQLPFRPTTSSTPTP